MKTYKKEYIQKVKEKFNDLQPNHNRVGNNIGKSQDAKKCDSKCPSKLVVLDKST